MSNTDTLILAAYEKLKEQNPPGKIDNIDSIWEEFLRLIKDWPYKKDQIFTYATSTSMGKIAGVTQQGSCYEAKNNFEIFLTDSTYVNPRNEYQTIESVHTTDLHKFNKDVEEHSISGIISLYLMYSQIPQGKVYRKLPYIDVLHNAVYNRMLSYTNYKHNYKPRALTRRFLNLAFQQSFTTIINENKLNKVARKLGISTKQSYVNKQMYTRSIIEDCINVYYSDEKSQYVRAATAWWISYL
ncbi:MAG TPA: hypothetical protein PKA28_17675 [Methylomusa anaerophila]|uniref:Uncharacterized protein n=1 Tax=Methylomusa anaerophila TaxID=1930071 RepID=A0A348AMG9_9FIRM|nr:hypothetical protein [Methylomusa anaerophila]BBB92267.1 hypothetical protein MAMMFC1_02952 [Methylomusa anaerophila]HML90274.1 hypothetical protein [Methylomusa anaerophila]